MTDHPITPPPELVQQWITEIWHEGTLVQVAQSDLHLADRASQWGADRELEACCKWTTANFGELPSQNLYLFRRPKPPSLKEQALEAAYRFYANNGHDNYNEKEIKDDFDIICRALEALPDD